MCAAQLTARFPHVQRCKPYKTRRAHAEASGEIRTLYFPNASSLSHFLRAASRHSRRVDKRGLDALDTWVRYMKKHIDTWRDLEDVHDLLTQYVAIFLEKPPADISPEDLHTLRWLLPPCATQLLSTRSFRAYRQPRFPDAPALTALLSQLTFARLGVYFRTLLPPLFEAAVHARVSSEFSRVVEEFARTPETARGWVAVGAPRGDTRGARERQLACFICLHRRWFYILRLRYSPMRFSQHEMATVTGTGSSSGRPCECA